MKNKMEGRETALLFFFYEIIPRHTAQIERLYRKHGRSDGNFP